jgi:hypothetical protein
MGWRSFVHRYLINHPRGKQTSVTLRLTSLALLVQGDTKTLSSYSRQIMKQRRTRDMIHIQKLQDEDSQQIIH